MTLRVPALASLLVLLAVPLAAGCASGPMPPAPLPEIRYAAPSHGMVWIDGSWHWNGADYTWLPGHWESPPPAADDHE